MTDYVECLFMCLFGVIFFFGEVLHLLPNFLIGLFTFLFMNFEASLYILDISHLSYMYFTNILSESMACVFILLLVSPEEQKFFILMKSILSHFFFYGLCF